jgi:hypothetical protein
MTPAAGGTLAVHAHRSDNSGIRANVSIIFNGQEVINDYTDSTTGNYSTPLPTGSYNVTVDPPSPYGTRRFTNVVVNAGQTTSLDALVRSVVEASPSPLRDTVAVGGTHAKTLVLSNTSTDSVPWRLSSDEVLKPYSAGELNAIARSQKQQSVVTFAKEQAGQAEGQGVSPVGTDGRGGPDAFGYVWIDSDEPGGPQYNWVEIRSVGTQITTWTGSSDDGHATVPLPFAFPFYGTTWATSVNVCTNGFISLNSTSHAYDNAALPTTGEPNNVLYPFWDDLNLGTAPGSVWYHHDAANGRFIIQYDTVAHYSSSGTGRYTFEVILKPGGEILFQYKSVEGTLNSATIGIENAGGTIGLQTVFNADYVHNQMAILYKLRGLTWNTLNPAFGILAPGAVQNVTSTFDGTGLTAGTTYNGTIFLDLTHPDVAGSITIPVSLTVEAAVHALLIVNKDSCAFGATPLNTTRHDSLTARNGGAETLTLTSITSTNPRFVVTPSSATLVQGDSVHIRIQYTPPVPALDTGRVIILSNSSNGTRKDILLSGSGFGQAHIVATPDSFTFSRPPGTDTTTAMLKIKNPGSDTLHFVIEKTLGSSSSVHRSMEQQPVYELAKNEQDTHPAQPPSTLGSGGPDSAGYRWFDSDDPGGPAYNWFDITPVGTEITTWTGSDDDGYATVTLPFSFPFYGNSYTSMNICTNGHSQLGGGTSTAYSNVAIPVTAVPNNVIYPFWDDMDLGEEGGSVWYYNDAAHQRFIVQYDSVSHFNPATTPGRYTYQMLLYPDGRIVVQYRHMEGTLNSATIGIENGSGTVALQVVFNDNYMHDNLALLFTQDAAPWMSTAVTSGTIVQGDSQQVQVRIHPGAMLAGDYTAYFRITGNTPDVVNVKVLLRVVVGVGETPEVIPTTYNLSQNYPNPFNPTTTIKYDLPEQATVTLTVYNMLGQEVATLAHAVQAAGRYDAVWDGRSSLGTQVSSGVYFYRLEARGSSGHSYTNFRKMVFLK